MDQELVPSSSDAISRELAEISNVNRTESTRYWRDKGMQARRRELIEAQLAGSKAAPAPTAGAQRAGRKLQLQAMMREGRSGRCWRDPALQAEYHAIIEGELSGKPIEAARDGSGNIIAPAANSPATTQTANTEGWRATPDQFRTAAPELAKRWGMQTEIRLTETQNNISAAIKAVAQSAGLPVAVEMENSFRALPPDAQSAVLHEISLPAPSGIGSKPASASDVKRFASTPEGRECVARWGSRAPRNVAMVRTRMERAVSEMSPASRKQFRGWLDRITGHEAAAIYGLLVGDISARR